MIGPLFVKEHFGHLVLKAGNGLAAMKVIATVDYEQRDLVLSYQGLVLLVTEYALANPHS